MEETDLRQILNLNSQWVFSKTATAVPAELDTTWEAINLPHTWNAVDGQDGGNDYFRGTCCYAKRLTKVELPAAEKYYLQIQGANSSADVYLNGTTMAATPSGV
jgi:beta-galactosidase